MSQSPLRLVKRYCEFIPKDQAEEFPRHRRGIYVLYKAQYLRGQHKYNVMYVGMATSGRRGGIRSRLLSHVNSEQKRRLWTHFSAFEVWDNILDEEIRELEGLFRFIYSKDSRASALNVQRGFKRLKSLRQNDLEEWDGTP